MVTTLADGIIDTRLLETVRQAAHPLTGASTDYDALLEMVGDARLERAIGVIYRPDTERMSHYFEACLPSQFDAVIHIDETRALEPLERTAPWESGESPETYPSNL